ncbi:type II toxin-antitoxin system VapC family toxin [Moraxella sp. ZJ142]|uniref:type II toxin-antitoxin system VapC family toxin n=1 Tax=Moraxella marmotae TaxID=3344520 RepID=UPI0035D45006
MTKAIAIDTNVLVRLFVQDDSNQKQITAVRNLLKDKSEVYISQIVQLELVWVLESSYQFAKEQVVFVLETLMKHSVFVLEKPNQFKAALSLFKNSNADFSDYLIFTNSQDNGYSFWTFDKKLSKTDGVNHLT